MPKNLNRRTFSKAALSTAATLAASARVRGANESVRLGFLGVGNRGCQLLKAFQAHPDARVVALCDVYEPYLNGTPDRIDPRFKNLGHRIPPPYDVPAGVDRVKDFRRVLERNDIDAVVIATPDHWHAIQMIEACRAGKDVYVEKAVVHHDRRGPRDGRGGAEARPDRAGRHASALVADVHAVGRGDPVRGDR